MACGGVLFILVVAAGVAAAIMPYPFHASCHIKWEVESSCESLQNRLINQMRQWEGDSLCPGTSEACPDLPCGQKCLYNYISAEDGLIVAEHLTPAKRYVDDLTFQLENGANSGKCLVDAKSSSRLWYAVLDFGTNYCNLRNLLDGAGFTENNDFTEETSNSVCTQYTSRDCSRF